jgi:hypothetical protein
VPDDFEARLLALTILGLAVGLVGVLLARAGVSPAEVKWGRGVFFGMLSLMCGGSVLAAVHRAEGLAPLGLAAGLLVVAMLWENSGTRRVGIGTTVVTDE